MAEAPKHPKEKFLGKQLQTGQNHASQNAQQEKGNRKPHKKQPKQAKWKQDRNFQVYNRKRRQPTLKDPFFVEKDYSFIG